MEPEGDVAKIMEYWNEARTAKTLEEIDSYNEKIIDLHRKNQWVIGYTGPLPMLYVVADDFHNVPETQIFSDEFRELGHGHPAQFFKEQ